MSFYVAIGEKAVKEEQIVEEGFLRTLRSIFESKIFSIGKTEVTFLTILELLLIIVFFFLLSRILRKFIRRQILPRFKLNDSAQFTILKLTHYLMMVIGLVFGLNSVGIQLTSLTVTFGVLGVGIAFGLQNITSNFISGIILLFERYVNVGDYVTVGDITGKVSSINIRSTTIITPNNTIQIVPNSRFIAEAFVNWTVRDPKIRISILVAVTYRSDVDLITRLLLKAAIEHKEVLSDPPPAVLLKGFENSAINFELQAWILDPTARQQITSDINYNVNSLFGENGIVMPIMPK